MADSVAVDRCRHVGIPCADVMCAEADARLGATTACQTRRNRCEASRAKPAFLRYWCGFATILMAKFQTRSPCSSVETGSLRSMASVGKGQAWSRARFVAFRRGSFRCAVRIATVRAPSVLVLCAKKAGPDTTVEKLARRFRCKECRGPATSVDWTNFLPGREPPAGVSRETERLWPGERRLQD